MRDPSEAPAASPERVVAETPGSRSCIRIAIVVLALFLGLTAVLAFTARSVHANNEDRLLRQRATKSECCSAPRFEHPVAACRRARFSPTPRRRPHRAHDLYGSAREKPVRVDLGLARGRERSATVLEVRQPARVDGPEPPAEIRDYLRPVPTKQQIRVLDLLSAPQRRLGYAFAAGPTAKYVVYAESDLPQNRRSAVDQNSAFSDLDYAIYLGTTDDPNHLLAASVADPHFTGRTAANNMCRSATRTLRIVLSPRARARRQSARAPALADRRVRHRDRARRGSMTERLVRRREHAERLAEQNAPPVQRTAQRCPDAAAQPPAGRAARSSPASSSRSDTCPASTASTSAATGTT